MSYPKSLPSIEIDSIESSNLRRFLEFLKSRQEKSNRSDYRSDAAAYTSDFSKNAL